MQSVPPSNRTSFGLSRGRSAHPTSSAVPPEPAFRHSGQLDLTPSATSTNTSILETLRSNYPVPLVDPFVGELLHCHDLDLDSIAANTESTSIGSEPSGRCASSSSMTSARMFNAVEPMKTHFRDQSSFGSAPHSLPSIPLPQMISPTSSGPNRQPAVAPPKSPVRRYAPLRPKTSVAITQSEVGSAEYPGEQSSASQLSSSEILMTRNPISPDLRRKRKPSQFSRECIPQNFLCSFPVEKKPRVEKGDERLARTRKYAKEDEPLPRTREKTRSAGICLRCEIYKERVSPSPLKFRKSMAHTTKCSGGFPCERCSQIFERLAMKHPRIMSQWKYCIDSNILQLNMFLKCKYAKSFFAEEFLIIRSSYSSITTVV